MLNRHYYQILIIQISLGIKFQLQQTILNFWNNFPKQGYFQTKTEKKSTSPLNSSYSNNSRYQILLWKNNFKFWPEQLSLVKNRKSVHHHWILLIRISLGTKFHLKLFLFNFLKKGVSGREGEKLTLPLNSAYPNYSEYQMSLYTNNFGFWDKIWQKRVFSVENLKNKHHHWILHIRN